MDSQIKKSYGKISIDSVSASQFKDHVFQAQLRQLVETTYPSKRVGNSNADMLFTTDDFNLPDGQSFSSTRVTWVDVPLNSTKASVTKVLAKYPNACIQRIISNKVEDCLTDEQKSGIKQGFTTLEHYEDTLRVRDNNGKDLDGPAQYRQYFFKKEFVEDLDLRTSSTKPSTNVEEEMLEVAAPQKKGVIGKK